MRETLQQVRVAGLRRKRLAKPRRCVRRTTETLQHDAEQAMRLGVPRRMRKRGGHAPFGIGEIAALERTQRPGERRTRRSRQIGGTAERELGIRSHWRYAAW